MFYFFVTTVIQTAVQVMGRVHVLFSHLLHMPLLSHLWCLTQMSQEEALELKCRTYQSAPQVSFYMFDMPLKESYP